MIRKLQWKIARMMAVVLMVLHILLSIAICLITMWISEDLSDAVLRDIGEYAADAGVDALSGGSLTGIILCQDADAGICVVTRDSSGQVLSSAALFSQHPLPQEDLTAILADAGVDGGPGDWGGYRYYQAVRPNSACLVISSNTAGVLRLLWQRLGKVIWLMVIPIIIVVFLLSVVLSRVAVRPAREALEKQRQFFSDAGHELKTPLAAINVNAAVLEEETGSSLYLDCIREESARMQRLLRRMMEASQMEGPEEGRRLRETVDLSALVYQAVLPFESLAFERNLRYELDIAPGLFCRRSDPDRLRQVAAILLDNAFKYVDEGGTVAVRLAQEGKRAVLEVSNTGPGIAPADLPRVFERFYRCDRARPDDGSYGLGLFIARTIVEEHRGQLTAASEPGVRTVFRVELRCAVPRRGIQGKFNGGKIE